MIARVAVAAVALVVGLTIPPTADEATMIDHINQLRATHGLPPVIEDRALTSVARHWSRRMARAGTISHRTPEAAWGDTMLRGENVGSGGSVTAVEDAFEASPAHLHVLLVAAYSRIGVGIEWSDSVLYVTELLEG